MRNLSCLVSTFVICVLATAGAFAPVHEQVTRRSAIHMATDNSDVTRGAARFFGLVGALSVLAFHPVESQAATRNEEPVMPLVSSSHLVADSIKTLDMSLPSYGEIKSSKASVENVASLSVPASQGGGTGIAASRKRTSNKKAGVVVNKMLPSMAKQSAEAKKKAAEEAKVPGYDF